MPGRTSRNVQVMGSRSRSPSAIARRSSGRVGRRCGSSGRTSGRSRSARGRTRSPRRGPGAEERTSWSTARPRRGTRRCAARARPRGGGRGGVRRWARRSGRFSARGSRRRRSRRRGNGCSDGLHNMKEVAEGKVIAPARVVAAVKRDRHGRVALGDGASHDPCVVAHWSAVRVLSRGARRRLQRGPRPARRPTPGGLRAAAPDDRPGLGGRARRAAISRPISGGDAHVAKLVVRADRGGRGDHRGEAADTRAVL
jgi:hypothetical protein